MGSSECVWKIHSYFHHQYNKNKNNIETIAMLLAASTDVHLH